jgi:D-3-phosphoglycerate dehydrogenase
MISDKEFGLMKDGSFLINTARGGLVDHEALGRALDSGKVAGAALDVQDPEPPDLSQPLMQNPRVLISPHAAFVSEESLIDLRIRATQNAIGVMTGQNVSNIVNKGCF